MPDGPVDEIGRVTNSAIRGLFDARFKGIRVVSEASDLTRLETASGKYWPRSLRLSEPGSQASAHSTTASWLNFGNSGVHVLLGKNGSGKSLLMGELAGQGTAPDRLLNAGLVFDLPSEESHEHWSRLSEEIGRSSWFLDDCSALSGGEDWYLQQFQLRDLVRLPVLDRVLGSIGRRETELNADFQSHTTESLLARYGFSAEAREHWRTTIAAGRSLVAGRIREEDGDGAVGPPLTYSHRQASASLFLAALRSSHVMPRLADPINDGGSWLTDSRPFLADSDTARLVGRAFEVLIAASDLLILAPDGGIQFVAPVPDDGPLGEILTMRQLALEDYDISRFPWGASPMFPFDLFWETEVAGRASVCTTSIAVDWRSWGLVDVMVLDLQNGARSQIEGLWSTYLDRSLHVTVRRTPDAGDDPERSGYGESAPRAGISVEVDGLDILDGHLSAISEDIEALGIGVGGLRRWSHFGEVAGAQAGVRSGYVNEHVGPGKVDVLRDMDLEWLEPLTGRWLPLELASQGQLDAILILLALALPDPRGRAEERTPAVRIVLADEFDQHLHPTATARLLETADGRARAARQVGLFSSHSVPVVTSDSLRLAPRVFATRCPDGTFSYVQGSAVGADLAAEILGVDPLEALRLKTCFLVVEGDHDAIVLRKLLDLDSSGSPFAGVEIINARGTWSFSGIWDNVLRHLSAPVMIVHDKKSSVLEDEWARVQAECSTTGGVPRWNMTVFHAMRQDINRRRESKRSQAGDDELAQVLEMVRVLLDSASTVPGDIQRTAINGLACRDVVELLPIEEFLLARQHGSWDAAHDDWRRRRQSEPGIKDFKAHYKINSNSIASALQRSGDDWHPELRILRERIRGLCMRG